MFWFRAEKKTLDNELRKLVKYKENAKIKSIIRTSNPSDLIDCKGTTIFHLAAKYSNLDLISFLLSSGYDINVRNSYGTTPLLMAILHNNNEVVKCLLDAKANLFIPNAVGQTPLQLLIDKRNGMPASVTEHLLVQLKSSNANAEEMARMLLDADCPLEFVLQLEKADVTETMLKQVEEISISRAHNLLLIAMNSSYLDNVKVLLHYGSKAAFRRMKFLQNLVERITGSPSELESARPFLLKLADWDVADAAFVEFCQHVFEKSGKPVLDLLLECNIDKYVRHKFDMELLTHAFVNCNDNVIELLRDEHFNVDARARNGQTALHIATIHSVPERIKLLLDRGANPNIKDKKGQTPLILAWDDKCIELLLRGGADVQVVDHTGLTVFERTNKISDPMRTLLAHLALIEARGVAIKRKICHKIDSRNLFKQFFTECKMHIERMKKQEVRRSLTLFMCLTEKPENLVSSMRDRETVLAALDCARKLKLHSFYLSTMEINLNRIVEMIDGRRLSDNAYDCKAV